MFVFQTICGVTAVAEGNRFAKNLTELFMCCVKLATFWSTFLK